MHAVQIRNFGGPEVLELVELDDPTPGPGQVLAEVVAIGVNYMDLNRRAGARGGELPQILGREGAGRVAGVGEDVTEVSVGDRIAWKNASASYAGLVVVNLSEVVPIPPGISEELAGAVLLQGLTAHYLATSMLPIGDGDSAVVHAAAGGVGLLLTQILKRQGVRVFATVSSAEKAELTRIAGAAQAIRYDEVDFAQVVLDLTDGEGVAVVYDGVGRTTFEGSLKILRPRGCLALYGLASGPIPKFELDRLSAKSLFITRPDLNCYIRTRTELIDRAHELFAWIKSGKLAVRIDGRYPLSDARLAHERLASRLTSGKLLLLPP